VPALQVPEVCLCANRGEFELSWSFDLIMLASLGANLNLPVTCKAF
jgi:hypothetical protein